jgi:hypothetical protein
MTPLLFAIKANLKKDKKRVLVNYLLLSGANPYIKGIMKKSGHLDSSPIEVVKRRGYKNLNKTIKYWIKYYGYKPKNV